MHGRGHQPSTRGCVIRRLIARSLATAADSFVVAFLAECHFAISSAQVNAAGVSSLSTGSDELKPRSELPQIPPRLRGRLVAVEKLEPHSAGVERQPASSWLRSHRTQRRPRSFLQWQ